MNAEESSFLNHKKSVIPVTVEYDYYESSSDIEFNHILELACFITNSPISFISFFENNLQCIKYTRGIPSSEMLLEQSLCQFPIRENNFYEIEDVTNNDKVKALLKTSDYDFKYFAGLPLVSPKGVIVGTICVIDQQAKTLNAGQIKAFNALGLQVINNLELHQKDLEEIKSKIKSEEFTDLFNSSPDLICLLNADQKIANINSAVFNIMGYNVKDCIGLNIAEFMLAEDKMNVFNTATESLRNKIKHFEVETRVIHKNKSIKWISWNVISKNKMWFVTGRDISKHKETLQQLHQLSTVASKINNGVVISNANNNVLWINNAFTKITGYTIEDLEDQKLGDVIVGADSDIDIIEKARIETQNKKSFSVELLAYRKDGKPIWLSIYNTIILDDKGDVESLIEIVIDITQRKEAEERLELLSLVASKTENGVSISDKTGRVKWINDSLSKILGYQLEELIGKRVGDIVKGADTDSKLLNKARDSARKSIPYNLELKVYKKDGTPVWLSVSNTPILDQQGNIEREIEIINDISDRKKAEIQLLEAKEQALRLSKAKEMFLSVMSHEIRTPLNAVIGITNILLEEENLAHQVQSLNLLKFSSDNLLNLINNILDFSKMEIGKMELEYKRLNIRYLVKDIVDSLAFKTNEKGVELRYKISRDLPELVRGDKTRLYQILINLINNALKFTEKGFVKVTVDVAKITKQHTYIHFEISDTGIGIPEDKFDDIFESFTQASASTSRKYGGTGLGLSITKKLIELYSGEIKVKSVLEKGSTFYFDLKFENFKETEMEIKQDSNAIKTLNAKVLVVDDNEINRILARKVLTKFQLEVVTAENGLKAIELLQSKDFDVVLLDIHMPEMSGYEVAEKLRAIDDVYFKELPIIALTASIMNEDLDTIYKYGMNDYQLKPFKPNELMEKIAKHLKK